MRHYIRIMLLVLAWCWAMPALAQDAATVQQQVVGLLSAGQRMELPIERLRAALTAHYITNHAPSYWVGTGRMDQFITRVNNATYDGLNAKDYPVDTLQQMKAAATSGDPVEAAKAELMFTAFFVTYATDLKIGRVTPQKLDPNLFRNPKTVDELRLVSDMGRTGDPNKFLNGFESKNPHYQALKKMLKIYTDAITQGIAWPVVGAGPSVAPGGSDARIAEVRRLLTLTGDYEGADTGSAVYDKSLAIAVNRFQTRHGLEAKGLLGKQTIIAMNVPPLERQKQIIINMERWRWMPDNLGEEHFLINIAGFELEHVLANTVIDRMNVVVGAVATQTPEFTGAMQYIELNPYWTVPYNIATGEMLPKLKVNPLAYAEEFELYAGGKLADWGSVNWAQYSATGSFPFTFRQKPGPKNALGKVKFMLPNRFNIYLHDTPAKDKFFNTTRAFSHGCIRLSQPDELAYAMLQRVGMDKAAVDAAWAAGQNQRVDLPKPVPVHLVYATAFSSENGIEFRTDVYGRDKKLYAALFGRPTS
jgi:L,D-transpeptidase YcbB